jgi:hypothetical protein
MFGGGAAVDASAFDASAFGYAAGLLGDGGIPCLNLTAGTSDPTCMSLSVAGMTLNGCCTSTGVCGNDLSIVGLGCNSFAALAGGLGGPGVLCGDAAAVVTPDAQAGSDVPADRLRQGMPPSPRPASPKALASKALASMPVAPPNIPARPPRPPAEKVPPQLLSGRQQAARGRSPPDGA